MKKRRKKMKRWMVEMKEDNEKENVKRTYLEKNCTEKNGELKH